MDENTIELVLRARDMASQAVDALALAVEAIPQTQQDVNARMRNLEAEATSFIAKATNDRIALAELEKNAKLEKLFEYTNQGLVNQEQYNRASQAIQEQALAAAAEPSFFQKIKDNWVAVTGSVIAAWMAVHQALEYVQEGAKALQTEESFHTITQSYSVDGDALLKKMQEVSMGMIDDSALMQRAVRALQQGLSADQLVQILEVSRASARTAGGDISAAFDGITTSIANQQTRALKTYGINVDMTKSFEDQAKKIGVTAQSLTEYEQTQALATAAISEGRRQLEAFGTMSLTAAEKLDQSRAQMQELKETIGKGLLTVLQAVGGGLYWLAAGAMDGVAALMQLSAWTAKMAGQTDVYKKLSNDAQVMFEAAGETANKGMKMWDGMGASATAAGDKIKGAAGDQRDAMNAAAIGSARAKAILDEYIASQEASLKTQQTMFDYQIAEEKKRYDQGSQSLEAYTQTVKDLLKQQADAEIELLEVKKQATAQDPTIKNESERAAKIAEIEGQIVEARLKGYQTELKAEDEYHKESLSKIEEAGQLKLNALKTVDALVQAQDEVAVRKGEMSQADFLQRQLDRVKAEAEAEIAILEGKATKEAALEGTGSDQYKQIMADKEALQLKYQATVIKSEQDIADAKTAHGAEIVARLTGYSEAEMANALQASRDKQKILEDAYAQGLVSTQEFEDAKKTIIKNGEDAAAKYIKDSAANYVAGILALINAYQQNFDALQATIQDLASIDFTDVRQTFRDVASVISQDYKSMDDSIAAYQKGAWHNLWSELSDGLLGAEQQIYLYGKNVTQMSAAQVQQWAENVRAYVQQVQDLFTQLQAQISSWQDELDSLKGNEMAILDRWYTNEKDALKAKYGDDLSKTKEYQEALTLLAELYSEKRKKVLENEQKANAAALKDIVDATQSALGLVQDAGKASGNGLGGPGASGGDNSGGPLGVVPGGRVQFNPAAGLPEEIQKAVSDVNTPLDNFSKSIHTTVTDAIGKINDAFAGAAKIMPGEIKVTKEINIGSTLVTQVLPGSAAERYTNDVIWPLIQKKFELSGVKL